MSCARLIATKFIDVPPQRADISPLVRSTMTLPSYSASAENFSTGTR
jgi:hypothetical protein